jgi:hypothetical protein
VPTSDSADRRPTPRAARPRSHGDRDPADRQRGGPLCAGILSALKVTVAVPVPPVPDVMVNHDWLDVAVHAQSCPS